MVSNGLAVFLKPSRRRRSALTVSAVAGLLVGIGIASCVAASEALRSAVGPVTQLLSVKEPIAAVSSGQPLWRVADGVALFAFMTLVRIDDTWRGEPGPEPDLQTVPRALTFLTSGHLRSLASLLLRPTPRALRRYSVRWASSPD